MTSDTLIALWTRADLLGALAPALLLGFVLFVAVNAVFDARK